MKDQPKSILAVDRQQWPTRPFVIFFNPRSGSTYLVSQLNSHPHVACAREVFHTVRVLEQHAIDPRIDIVSCQARRYYRRMEHRGELIVNPSEEQTVMRLNELLIRKKSACGFKFSYPIQVHCFPEVLAEMQKLGPKLHVIVLRRRNLLKIAVSLQNMERIRSLLKSNRSNFVSDENWHPFHLDVDRAVRHVKFNELANIASEPLIQQFEQVLRIDYEDMLSDNKKSLQRILRYIGVSPKFELSSEFNKVTPDNLREAIKNYGELEAKIKGTRFEEFLDGE